MDLGSALHNNYYYYGSSLDLVLVLVAGGIGFLAPGIIVWKPHKELFLHFSLRALLIATTLVAVVLGLVVFAARK